MRTMTGIQLREPLTSQQRAILKALEHEERVLVALGMVLDDRDVHDMDRRRVRDTMNVVTDVAELRCAALRASLRATIS